MRRLLPNGFDYGDKGQGIESSGKLEVIDKFPRLSTTKYVTFKIFLDVPFEESKNRAMERDVLIHGEEVLGKCDGKYLPAQRRYGILFCQLCICLLGRLARMN